MKIFFVRHAQTRNNANKSYPSLDDNENYITEIGEDQATRIGKYLKKFGKFDLIISSPRLRAIQTAELIAKQINYNKNIIINNLIAEPMPSKK